MYVIGKDWIYSIMSWFSIHLVLLVYRWSTLLWLAPEKPPQLVPGNWCLSFLQRSHTFATCEMLESLSHMGPIPMNLFCPTRNGYERNWIWFTPICFLPLGVPISFQSIPWIGRWPTRTYHWRWFWEMCACHVTQVKWWKWSEDIGRLIDVLLKEL